VAAWESHEPRCLKSGLVTAKETMDHFLAADHAIGCRRGLRLSACFCLHVPLKCVSIDLEHPPACRDSIECRNVRLQRGRDRAGDDEDCARRKIRVVGGYDVL
jgi:hypothetical protein